MAAICDFPPEAAFQEATPLGSFFGTPKILEFRHSEPDLHFAFFSNVVRLAFELKQVAWLTIEHVANLGQGFESHTADLAGPDKRQVLF